MPSYLIPDYDSDGTADYRGKDCIRIEARLHPAQDAKGPRPTTRFEESEQHHDPPKVCSGVGVGDYEQVVCSINLAQLSRAWPIEKFDVEATSNEDSIWTAAFTYFMARHKGFLLQSPSFSLKSTKGKIEVKVRVLYIQTEEEKSEWKGFEEYQFIFGYRKFEGKTPILYKTSPLQEDGPQYKIDTDSRRSSGPKAFAPGVTKKRKRGPDNSVSSGRDKSVRPLPGSERAVRSLGTAAKRSLPFQTVNVEVSNTQGKALIASSNATKDQDNAPDITTEHSSPTIKMTSEEVATEVK